MMAKAYAKINIALDVVGKREDGYHLLKMIMQQIDLYDVITVEKQGEGISMSCNKKYVPLDKKNLAYKAAELFLNKYSIHSGVKINIEKNIPVSAGLAGGSTDAATVLILLNKIFNVKATEKELMDLGLQLGADVPYCITGGTALCENIGEVITKLKPFKNHILVVAKPNFGISTKEVYRHLDISKIYKHPRVDEIIKYMEKDDLKSVCSNMKNVLENVTLRKHNELIKIKEKIMDMNALGVLMSGSGPTIFAFYEDMLLAQRCYEKLKMEYNEVFITRTL
ncbi:4-diphosphocytidyl-2-C-methyl-D-erythritol kinase [Clostridium amylolyticum]|uniref:4-diphosphocytidyl-2-C-methyl-D-erythritol kinase n=1 Tax=Clostridium amylolyticum TaxID=1121298 RepID=A0A1M6B6I9_9CLOT|nr:4-(cytidine 5'-diphospho)-2-C-methyl-D-erythritol kinase [Clostridium amylolyticum]SHI44351.1 4-diphosphocytidyl-2-C-methyl-D-erythritol kinase [Clostridium amylolyticum]